MRPDPRTGPGRLPRRRTDRLEDGAVWLFFVAGLLVVVLAGTVGLGVLADAAARARQEAAERTPVTATALRDAPLITAAPGSVAPLVLVDVAWTGPDGVPQTGRARVSALTRAGRQVPIWLDAAGEPVAAPTGETGAAIAALTSTLVVVLVGGMLLAVAWAGVRRGDRRAP